MLENDLPRAAPRLTLLTAVLLIAVVVALIIGAIQSAPALVGSFRDWGDDTSTKMKRGFKQLQEPPSPQQPQI